MVIQSSPLKHFLQAHPAVKFIHCQYVDLSGVLREVVVISDQALIHEAENKPLNFGPTYCEASPTAPSRHDSLG